MIAQLVVIAGLVVGWVIGVHSFAGDARCWASCSASPARRSRWPCRWPRAGIRPSTRAPRSASPAPAIRAPCSPRCSRRASRVAFGWQQRARPRRDPAGARLRASIVALRQGQPRPRRRPRRLPDYLTVLKIGDTWWFMFFYSVTFGGFVGLASSLTIYFNDQYGLSAGDRRLFHRRLRLRRLDGPPDRRRGRRPHRRRPRAVGHVLRLRPVALARAQHRLAAGLDGARRVRRRRCWRSAWAMARCSSSCRSASAARSAS